MEEIIPNFKIPIFKAATALAKWNRTKLEKN